jgi:UDP-2,4-diacetamido-2,4,6-trideoxy-beta-L-altropyranose hydrolase
MKAAIRTDASPKIGTGHVMRCLTIADALAAKGAEVTFLCRELPPHLEEFIARQGHKISRLDPKRDDVQETLSALRRTSTDWLIVDHYGLDARWEKAARPGARRLLAIDDLADRPHACDALLDPAFGEDGSRYRSLVPAKCRGLYGPAYLLLRPQFAQARKRGLPQPDFDEPVAHVFFGGSDQNRYTTRFSRALASGLPRLKLEIAVGKLYPDTEGLDRLRKDFPGKVAYEREMPDMAAHMSRCSVALGAPGMATWERACLGLPSAYIATNPNQIPILKKLEEKGFCRYLGAADKMTDKEFTAGIGKFLADRTALVRMRELGMAAIDGKGAERVAEFLLRAG